MFGKPKTAEEILKLIETLSDEEQDKLYDKLVELDDEEEDNEKEETVEVKKTEEVEEPETEDETEETEETTEDKVEETVEDETETQTPDEKTDENRDEIVKALADRVRNIEETLKDFVEIKEQLNEMTKKRAEEFGYKGYGTKPGKDYSEMDIDELKNQCLIKA